MRSRLTRRITFEQPVEAQDDDTGESVITWTPYEISPGKTLVAAEVLEGPGKENITAGARHAEVAARITCRYFTGLDESWRIVHGENIYNIATIARDRTGLRDYRLTCTGNIGDGS